MSTQPAAQTVTTNADNPTAAATEAVNKLTEHTATADTYLFDDVQATLDWRASRVLSTSSSSPTR